MVKFLVKNLWWMIGFWIILIAFFSAPASFYRSSDNAGASVVDSVSDIKFYGADNETVIYDVKVPFGYSLNDLQNSNFVSNSCFSLNTNGLSSYINNNATGNMVTVDDWQIRMNVSGINTTQVNVISTGVNVVFSSNSVSGGATPFIQILPHSFLLDNDLLGKIVTFSLYCSSISSGSARVRVSNYSTFATSNLVQGLNVLSYAIPSNTSGDLFFGIITNANTSFNISLSYAKLELGNIYTPYFDYNYLNQLYINSGGSVSSDYVWSQSPVAYTFFSFSNNRLFSTRLYYIYHRQSFIFDKSLPSVFEIFSKQSSYTQSSINTIKNVYYEYNNLNIKSVRFSYSGLIVINAIFVVIDAINNFILKIGMIIMLVFSLFLLIVAPFVDIISYIIAIIYGSFNAWSFF